MSIDYDMEKTSQAVRKQSGGNTLDPMYMLYTDVENCFRLLGEKGKEITVIKEVDARQTTKIDALEGQIATLQKRLWGLLAGVILAAITGGVTWLSS